MQEYMIHSYGGQEILSSLFNAIARIFQSESAYFTPVGTLALTIGAIWATTRAIFNANVGIFGKQWFVPSFLAFTLLFTPKTTVWIKDEVSSNSPVKIDNIPFAIAGFSSLSSKISYALSEMIEDHLMPAENTKSKKVGLMFGAKVVGKVKDIQISDPVLLENTKQFTKQCFQKPWIMGNFLGKRKAAMENNDILAFTAENPAHNFGIYYKDPTTHQLSFKTCAEMHGSIKADLEKEALRPKSLTNLGLMLGFGAKDPSVMAVRMNSISKDTLEYLQRDNASIHHWMKQAMLLNANRESMDDWRESHGLERFYPHLVQMNATRGVFQQSFGWITAGEMAAETLPLMQTILFGIIICSIFVVFPFAMLPGGMGILKTWIQMLLWVNSWPVFFSIINCIGMQVLALRSKGMGGDVGLSILSQGSYAEMVMNTYAIVQLFATMVPVISWVLVSKSGQAFANLTERLSPVGAGNALGASMVDNTMNMDNVSVGNRQIAQQNVAPSLMEGSRVSTGIMTTMQSPEGESIVQQQVSQGATGFNVNEGYSKAMQQGKQESVQYQESLSRRKSESENYGDALSFEFVDSLSQGKIGSDSFGMEKQQSFSSAMEKAQSNAQNMIQRDSKLTETLSNMGADVHAGVNAGGVVAKLVGLEVGGNLHAGTSIGARNAEELSQDLTANFTDSEREAWNEAKTMRQDQRFTANNEEGARLAENMRQNVEEQKQLSNDVSAAQSRTV